MDEAAGKGQLAVLVLTFPAARLCSSSMVVLVQTLTVKRPISLVLAAPPMRRSSFFALFMTMLILHASRITTSPCRTPAYERADGKKGRRDADRETERATRVNERER